LLVLLGNRVSVEGFESAPDFIGSRVAEFLEDDQCFMQRFVCGIQLAGFTLAFAEVIEGLSFSGAVAGIAACDHGLEIVYNGVVMASLEPIHITEITENLSPGVVVLLVVSVDVTEASEGRWLLPTVVGARTRRQVCAEQRLRPSGSRSSSTAPQRSGSDR
jgi:hypothetical protein